MSTAGNLVFQGRGSGELWVYAADTGKVLKTIQTGSHIMAAPMTYAVNGEQYVAVQVGYGGTNIAGTRSHPAALPPNTRTSTALSPLSSAAVKCLSRRRAATSHFPSRRRTPQAQQ